MKHRPTVLLSLIAMTVFAANAGCNRTPTPPATTSPNSAAHDHDQDGHDHKDHAEILVGHYASITGAEATFGRSTDEGILLAIKEINAAGGLKVDGSAKMVEMITDDTESQSTKAADVVRKLIDVNHVSAVLGEVASSISLEGAPVCQEAGVPMITPSSTNTAVTEKGDYIFRVCFIDPFQGWAGAKFAHDDLKATKVAVLIDTASAYSKQLAAEFVKAFEKFGGKVVASVEYQKGEKEFNARLTKIREAAPDVIYIPGYYQDIANIALQARQLDIKAPMMGGDGWDSEELGKNAGDAIDGCFFTNHYAFDDPSPEIQTFVSNYRKEYGGKTPDGLAALGYDAMHILAQAFTRAGTIDGKKLRDEIGKTANYKGVTGTITINDKRNAVKPIVILERKKGQWVFRARIQDPQSAG